MLVSDNYSNRNNDLDICPEANLANSKGSIMSSSVNKVCMAAGIHLLLSYIAMSVIVVLTRHHPNEPIQKFVAVSLLWVLFFPSIILGLINVPPIALGFELFPINTLCWFLIFIPALTVIRKMKRFVERKGSGLL